MKIDIVSVHPDMVKCFLQYSILKRGLDSKLLDITVHNLRSWTDDKHQVVDDKPYGGGPGMILKIEPLVRAIRDLKVTDSSKVIMTTPKGKVLHQELVRKYLKIEHIIIICGHYKGIDSRISNFVDDFFSLGNYILTGGELAAAVLTDALSRLIPGVISDIASAESDSFETGLLDCRYYTRPENFEGLKVPKELLSGNHQQISQWRINDAKSQTEQLRPDLYLKNVNN